MSITATLDQIQAQLEDVTRANPRIDYEELACAFADLYGPPAGDENARRPDH